MCSFMRVFALSDIHCDYPQNLDWVRELSVNDYRQDVLLLAGDVSDDLALLGDVLSQLAERFVQVVFVPGNHELWVRNDESGCSLEKFHTVQALCEELGVATGLCRFDGLSIVPLFSWYDFTFGAPDRHLRRAWRDFRACSWPAGLDDEVAITEHFLSMNEDRLDEQNDCVISLSHFLPRLDVMPERIPERRRRVYPVLGSERLGVQLDRLQPHLHVYGHSHVNQAVELNGIRYVNNAFAYPDEQRIARKQLLCVWDAEKGMRC